MTTANYLKNQVYLYSLETGDFYTDEEEAISQQYFELLQQQKELQSNLKQASKSEEVTEEQYQALEESVVEAVNELKKQMNDKKNELKALIATNNDIRTLREDALKENKIISIFDSTLLRVCNIKPKELSEELFIIRVFHYDILHNIITNGFMYKGERYEYFTSSAGQIRTKKIVCIKSSLYTSVEKTVTCDLSLDDINAKGGVNANKYQAYLALINSASDTWKRFNIDRMVVVEDFETTVNAEVDHIDMETFEITRKMDDVVLPIMDGCGIMLPSVSKKSFMFRMAWMKGLLTPFDFKRFAIENGNTKITDIYGKEYDIIEDDINIILTKSQFKMWKYYDSWDDYKTKFKANKCEASKLNIEEIADDARINYQMLQTLTSMTEEDLRKLAEPTIEEIIKIGTDKQTMLDALGANKNNRNPKPIQKALMIYPELLNDSHSKETIKNKKRSLVRSAKAGKLKVKGKYTFLIPDLYAFCEWLFLGTENPKGILKDKEVYCKLFEEGEVDVLRAPHLYREHAVRDNVKRPELDDWFISQGIYTSSQDLISKILQFDNDGDKALVVQEKIIIDTAKRDMEGIVPLVYDMKKADNVILTPEETYKSLTSAYKANIGIISNDITKIWNGDNPDIRAVKWMTALSNFTIDYAKTLYMPTIPKYAEEIIKSFTKNKVPHFFKYAKDKESGQVESINDSTVNKLESIIPNKAIQFKKIAGNFDFRVLQHDYYYDPQVIEVYNDINRRKYALMGDVGSDYVSEETRFANLLREELFKIQSNEDVIVDTLVNYLYTENSRFKSSLWDTFGDVLVKNITSNIEGTTLCEKCNKRGPATENNNTKYCKPCSLETQAEKNREYARKSQQKRRAKKC